MRPTARTALALPGNATLTTTMRTHQAATAAQLAAAGTSIAGADHGPARHVPRRTGASAPLTRDVLALIANPGDTVIRWLSADVQRRGVPVPAPIAAKLGTR